jgi:SAM-dependent methyltransferase
MTRQTFNLREIARRVVAALPVPLADKLRGAKRAALNTRSRKNVFIRIAEGNEWGGTESVSGPGSTLEATRLLREALPDLLAKYEIKSLLDVPCGDAYWITQVLPDGVTYTGGDIVPALIEKVRAEKGDFGNFFVIDLVTDDLPQADLVMVRDCFIHLPHAMVKKAIDNVKRSGARYLLTTTYPGQADNIDIEIGGYRPVDLQRAPFDLPPPLTMILETEGVSSGKSMALWDVSAL